MASALFKIDGNPLSAGYVAVSASASVALVVVDTTGASSIEWSCVGTHSSSVATSTITAAITPAGSPAGATATLAMPSGAGQAYLIRCLVRDGQGLVADYKQGKVVVLNGNSIPPLAFGETSEHNITHGWIDPVNTFLNTAPGGALLTTGGTMSGDINMGNNDITNVDILKLGPTPAASGRIRVTNNNFFNFRNAANSADLNVLGVNASDVVVVGSSSNVAGLRLRTTTGTTCLDVAGTTELEISTGLVDAKNNTLRTTGVVEFGNTPASTGTVRLGNNNGLWWRNNAGSGDVRGMYVNTSDVVILGYSSSTVELDSTMDANGNTIERIALNLNTPTGLSGDVNDYNPTNLDTADVLRVDPNGASRNITGISAPSYAKKLCLANIGSAGEFLTLKYEDAGSSAANRFIASGLTDITVSPGESVNLFYDTTSSRWRQISAN